MFFTYEVTISMKYEYVYLRSITNPIIMHNKKANITLNQ